VTAKSDVFVAVVSDRPLKKRSWFKTTGQTLRAGKPMLVMPHGGDQYDNGARIERLGAGLTIIRKQYRVDRVAVLLKQLFDNPSYREKATDLGRRISAENGVSVACDAIERQLSQTA
jgi:UDP:flavonoid glycosyltransferase YjiC (YdhE family)